MNARLNMDAVRFDDATGTIVVVAQDVVTGAVLMVANADREALARTLETGEMHYLSRRRGPWHKGATSGNIQKVISLELDCDGDTLLARVVSAGPACHTGRMSCFSGATGASAWSALTSVVRTRRTGQSESGVEDRSYTSRLLSDRNMRLKKLGEETAELIVACADGNAERAAEEAADLIYHAAVALEAVGSSLDAAGLVLFERSRAGKSER